MKKIISLLLTMLLLITFVPATCAGYTDTQEESILLVSGLGLMEGYDDGTFLPDNFITRAEFAQLIANIYANDTDNLGEWEDIYFRDTEEEKTLITEYGEEAEAVFSDVDANHWAYAAVNTVYNLGYMEGISATEFDPDGILTASQIYKILSVMLGYRMKAVIRGGYPSGYIAVANEIGLSDGVSNLHNITRAEVARILTNAFEVEILYLSSVGEKQTYETYPDKTFLSEFLGLRKVSGQMTDNGLTSIDAASTSYENDVVVDNKLIRLTEETEYIRDFIGRDIDLYYKADEDMGINLARYAMLTGKDEAVKFDATDFLGIDMNSISYNCNDKAKTLNLKNGAPLIKNGMAIETPALSDFTVNKGEFTVIKSNKSSVYELVILDSYVSFNVEAVDSVDKKIYSSSTVDDDGIVDFSDENKTYIIYDEKGNSSNFDAISKGSILSISDSSRMMKVYISKTVLSDAVINEMHTDGGKLIATIGKTEYVVSRDYIELKGENSIEVGKSYSIYLDKFGEIVNISVAADNKLSVALMMDIKNFGSLESDYQLKYFDVSGSVKTSSFAPKVTVLNGDTETIEKDHSKLETMLNGYNELFRYKLNDDKQISYIELAANQDPEGSNPENRLLRINLDRTKTLTPYDVKNVPYGYYQNPYTPGYGRSIQGLAFGDSTNTKVFLCTDDFTDEETIRVANMTSSVFPDGTASGKSVKVYTVEGDAPYANYVISKSASVNDTLDPKDKLLAIVKKVVKGLDPKGNPANIITVYENGTATETKLYCEDAVLNDVRDIWGRKHSNYDAVNKVWGNDVEKYEIEMGDIIRYTKNSDGTLSKIYLMFDENGTNPASGGQGSIAGSYGNYDAAKTTVEEGLAIAGTANYIINANPYCITNGDYVDIDDDNNLTDSDSVSTSKFNNGMKWDQCEFKNIFGYPVLASPKSFTLTTLDLSVNDYDYYTLDTAKYARETYYVGSLVLYVIEGNNLYPVSIQTKDLKTYKLAGNDCDRIYGAGRNGSLNVIIPIRGKTTK